MKKLLVLAFMSLFLAPAFADVTYESPALGFSLKYPKDWTEQQSRYVPFLLTFPSSKVKDPQVENFYVNVTRLSGSGGSGMFAQMERSQLESKYPGMKLTSSKAMKLKNFKDAHRFEFEGQHMTTDMKLVYVILFEDDKMYTLSFVANEKDFKRLSYKVEKIIKSFRVC